MTTPTKIVIYTRFSSDMQSPKSCPDQEREVRTALTRMGIGHSDAVVIHDEAESGTRVLRDEFARLTEMMARKELRILAVDDQARLTRADNAFAFITDLVYSGGRFISTGEGIDTTQQGWELRVKVMELHNSTTILELGRRVRRGQLGRILSGLSAGDFPFGFEAYYLHPELVREDRRGPKPEKGVRIDEVAARWVRQIFAWFVALWSIGAIARELNRLGAPRVRRQKGPWTAQHVRRILGNQKYIGVWGWGDTMTIRNSQGKKRQVPVPLDQRVVHQRPDLRIVEQSVWEEAQQRLREMKDVFGKKVGQKPRGPKVHHLQIYPGSLLGGLLYCGCCGSRMWYSRSGERVYLACPKRGKDTSACKMTTTVPIAKAETAILDFVGEVLSAWPDWISGALAEMRSNLEEIATRVPERIAADERRRTQLLKQIANLVDSLADGMVKSSAIAERLSLAETEAEKLQCRIEESRPLIDTPIQMPDNAWISEEMANMANVLREDERRTAILLRRLMGRVAVHHVIPPGKKRGYAYLRFRINGWELLRVVLDGKLSDTILNLLVPEDLGQPGLPGEFQIDLGGPSQMDEWGPRIAEMRAQGIPWKDIWEVTGLGSGPAYVAWKRYVDSQTSEADSDESFGSSEEDQPDAA